MVVYFAWNMTLCTTLLVQHAVAGEVEWKVHIQTGRTAYLRGEYGFAVAHFEASLRVAMLFAASDHRLATNLHFPALI